MKRILLGLLAGLILGGLAVGAFLKRRAGGEEKAPEAGPEERSYVQRGTHGEVTLKLDQETQKRMGLQTLALQAAEWNREAKAYGRVLDPAPLVSLAIELSSARASSEASGKEFERMKILNAQNQNVSARALEVAELAQKRDQILFEAAEARLMLALGQAGPKPPELPRFIQSLVSLQSALVQLELPAGEALESPPLGARISALGRDASFLDAQFLGAAPSADPATQGQAFLFRLDTNTVMVGAAVTGYLKLGGPAQAGVVVPREALLRHQGELYAYLQTGEETFERRPVSGERPLENGWFVAKGFKAGQKIVMAGGQQLLSEELKAAPESAPAGPAAGLP